MIPHQRYNRNGASESRRASSTAARCSGELCFATRDLNTSVPHVGASSRKLTEVQTKRVSRPRTISPKGPRITTTTKATAIRQMRTAHAVPFAMVLAGMRLAKDTARQGATPAKRPRGSAKQAADTSSR